MDFEDSQFQVAPAASGLVFDSSAPSASAVNESSSVVNGLDEFFGSSAPAVPALSAGEVLAADFTTAAPANTNAFFPLDDNAVPGTPAANVAVDDDPFFQHYFPPAPSAPATVPEVVDPRVEWRKHNNELLKKKDAEESSAKMTQRDAAIQYLAKYYEARATTLAQRKTNNRKLEAHQKEAEVPAGGAPWEKVNALVNFNSGNHQKDVTRYKALLITCKAKNVAISA